MSLSILTSYSTISALRSSAFDAETAHSSQTSYPWLQFIGSVSLQSESVPPLIWD